MAENPLIAESEGTSAGAGSVWASDVLNLTSDIEQGSKLTFGVDMTLAGIDLLMTKANPFGSLIANGVGWLLEHIPGLSDAWDKLTGDAAAIEQISRTWNNIGTGLMTAHDHFDTASNEIEQWSGKAADSYRSVATGYSGALEGVSVEAQAMSAVVELIGGGVSGCKDAVYDLISEFIEFTVIPAILGAIATAWCTFGGSVAVAISYIEVQADVTAGQVTLKITEVTEKIIEVSNRGKNVIDKTIELTEKLETLEHSLDNGQSALRRTATTAAKGTGRGEVEGTRPRTQQLDGTGGGEPSRRSPAEATAR